MQTSKNSIHVALASDNNYFEGLLTTAVTIATNCSRSRDLVFHILDKGISREKVDFLLENLKRYDCKISVLDITNEHQISGFKPYHGSTVPYARLLLPDLLPSVNQVIYSDVDILWLIDIAELWDSLDGNAVMHYVPPHPNAFHSERSIESDWLIKNGFQPKMERRFCSGMIVMNLQKFRAEKLHHQMLAVLDKNDGHAPNDDETILNAFMFSRNDTKAIDFKWQIGTGNTKAIPKDLKVVLHYAADTPWKTIHQNHHMVTDAIFLWHKIHASIRKITPWQSLRQCNSPFDIITGRLLYLAASNFSFIRCLLRAVLTMRGHREGIPRLNAFMTKSNIKKLL